MIKKIDFEIMFTPYTIDTYNIFTFEREEEYILENLNAEYDDIAWNYKHADYVQALADNWVKLLNDNILDDVILKIESKGKATSPREYNFRTDDMDVCFHVNIKNLNAYIEKNKKQFESEKIRSRDGFMWFGDEIDTRLHWYLNNVSTKDYSEEDYFQDQLEKVEAGEYVDYQVLSKK